MSALLTALALAVAIALLLSRGAGTTVSAQEFLTDTIDSLLPQTQCGKCGYNGCRPYAAAIARGDADINQCPPGGQHIIRQLAQLLGREIKPLNPAFGKSGSKTVALIDENLCIGCVKCIRACPVDAIVGAPKQMHTVIAAHCTGCELCIPPCPVDCISMLLVTRAGHRIKLKSAALPAPVSP
ncbi:MAG: electron transport complex subunit RsxB [Gammaproteobacteria bacterium]